MMNPTKVDSQKKEVVEQGPSSLRFKLLFLIPTFLIATILGFCIEILFFEKINLEKISQTLKDSYLINPYYTEPEESMYYISVEKAALDVSNEADSLNWEDVQSLLDIEDFNFLINDETICAISGDQEGKKLLLLLVSSERHHFKERLAFRQTYSSVLQFQDTSVHLAFLLGMAKPAEIHANPFQVDNETISTLLQIQEDMNKAEDQMIHKENSLYRDLIMGNFVDNSSNEIYKHFMGYKWVLNFCPWASYVLKLDDNIFVNLHRFITNELFSSNNDFICDPVENSTSTDHNIVAGDNECDLETEDFPAFCPAWFYGISPDWIFKIYSESQKYPHSCTNAGGFITGILRQKAEKSYGEDSTILKLNTGIQDKNMENSSMDLCTNNSKDDITETVVYLEREANVPKNLLCLWKEMIEKSNLKNLDT